MFRCLCKREPFHRRTTTTTSIKGQQEAASASHGGGLIRNQPVHTWILGFQTKKNINFCCLNYPVCGFGCRRSSKSAQAHCPLWFRRAKTETHSHSLRQETQFCGRHQQQSPSHSPTGPLGSDTCLLPVLQKIKAVQRQVLARGGQYLKPGHLKGKQEVGWAAVSRSTRDTR